MVHWKRWLFALGAAIIVLGIILLLSSLVGINSLVDFWWFDSLGYAFYYWQRLLYRYVVFGSVTLLFFLIFFLNFWVASRYLGTTTPPETERKPSSLKAYKDIAQMFRTGSMRVYTPLSILLAVPIALPLFEKWESFLLYVFARRTGVHESVFGKDIAYYLFSFPIYTLLQRRLLLAFTLLFFALLFLYWLERRLLSQQDQHMPRGAKLHLSAMILIIFLIEIWDYFLQRYQLLYDNSHEPLFFGPGFIEMRILLPLIYVSLFFLMGTAISLIASLYNRKALKVLAVFAICFALALGARYSTFLPRMVQKYIVKPNEISRERPFIERNIEATLAAYNLLEVQTRDFSPSRVPVDISSPVIRAELRNIPVWDGELLEDVYRQLQQLRTYYDFPTVDVDRYLVNNIFQQVFLSARELEKNQISPSGRNWVNDHLSYTHGYGVVMTPASQGGDEPMTWFIRGIPPESDYGFSIEQPGIYFGQAKYDYVIAPNDAGEFDYPKGSTNAIANYNGKGGVPFSSLYRKFLFAFYFKDKNLFFTTKTNDRSKILFRQNITERIQTITPYFSLDEDPYLVVTPRGIFWIQDAFTTSSMYPYAAPFEVKGGKINYIRNSVKIVIDAYNGTVDYYLFDNQDPIIQAYNFIYPGLFKTRDQMPQDLLPHVRYPKDLFTVQLSMYNKYHQTDTEVFYQQEDLWEFAKTFRNKEVLRITPYYVTLDLIEPSKFSFILLSPLSPKGRDNLRALALVGCDPPDYGKIIVYNFPKGELIYGPSQIYALINQDTTVSQQFTLWDQSGSQVDRGKMIILPIGGVMLYIQPVYLKSSTQIKIPELKRLIMSEGQIVIMEKSLEDAYTKLQQRTKSEVNKVDERFAPLMNNPPEGSREPQPSQQPSQQQEGDGRGNGFQSEPAQQGSMSTPEPERNRRLPDIQQSDGGESPPQEPGIGGEQPRPPAANTPQ